jgi:hypothetical protein
MIQGFSYYFCMMIEGYGSRAGSIPLTSGSGSGRPKKHVDPVDPEHWLKKCVAIVRVFETSPFSCCLVYGIAVLWVDFPV